MRRGNPGCRLRYMPNRAVGCGAEWERAMTTPFRLDDKVAAITGAGSGIGAATARLFGRAGAKVYVLEKNAEAGAAVVEQVRAEGATAELVEVDVSAEMAGKAAAGTVLKAHGR